MNNQGLDADLAQSGSQRGWDVRVWNADRQEYRYVQVKVYDDAEAATRTLENLESEMAQGLVTDENGQALRSIEFAVNHDIYEEIKAEVQEHGINVRVMDIGATRDEIRQALEAASDNVITPLDNFFQELFGSACRGAALHAAINCFLVWKGAKEREQAIEDTAYSSVITVMGMATSFGVEAFLGRAFLIAELESAAAVLVSPIGALALTGVGLYARGVLKRLSERRHVAKRLTEGNQMLTGLIASFAT